jgi:intracellular sulfur oxidation DsrE/DsrF family protein
LPGWQGILSTGTARFAHAPGPNGGFFVGREINDATTASNAKKRSAATIGHAEDTMMKRNGVTLLNLFIAILLLGSVSNASGEEYDGIANVKTAKIVFDERESNPKAAALHLQVAYQAYKDLAAMKKDPAVVIVFSGPSVKLISKNKAGFSPEDQKTIDEIANTISSMSKDGIRSEICLIAAKYFEVDPATVLPEIKRVGNGWISLTVYQAQGYSLVPVY